MPLSGPTNASSTLNYCSVRIILLNKEELRISVESKNVKIGYLFNKACEHVAIKETEYFGLAQQKDGEFYFLKTETRLQKFASKLWKSKHIVNNEPLLTFYLRVQYYVDNVGLLRDPVTCLQFYLQLRDNMLHYGLIASEEQCFILASHALQADFGPYNPDVHVAAYFDPCKYFPSWVIMRRGHDYIINNLPVMHKDMASYTQTESRSAFIRELLSSPLRHNFHLYPLRRHKYDNASTVWIAICPRGLEIIEEVNGFKNQIALFLWQNIEKLHCDRKKFEIVTDSLTERRFSYYVVSKEWGDHLLGLCRSTHHFQMALQPRVAEMQPQEVQDQHFRELYVHGGNVRFSHDWQRQKMEQEQTGHVIARSFDANRSLTVIGHNVGLVAKDASAKSPNGEDNDDKEIMIVSPPLTSSTLTTISPMSELSISPVWLYAKEQLNSKNLPGVSISDRKISGSVKFGSHGGSFTANHPVSSLPKSNNSSDESLITGSLSNSTSPSIVQLQPSASSSPAIQMKCNGIGTEDDMKTASSIHSMSSWLSVSPNSSSSSSQLTFSLPTKTTIVDAASLRKSLPHGTTLNEYISRIMSGEDAELLTSKFHQMRYRKSSLDQPKMCFTYSNGDSFSRSASSRQAKELPICEQGDLRTLNTNLLSKRGFENDSVASPVIAQHLPQVPITAQVHEIVIPNKMTAISTSVWPMTNCASGDQVNSGREYFSKLFSTEKPVSMFPPLHSTPLASKHQMQEIRVPEIPVLSTASNNSFDFRFNLSQTAPFFSFPVPPVISTSEIDYRGEYFPRTLAFDQNPAAKLSTFGELATASNQTHNATFMSPSSWLDPSMQTRSKPPPYSEWQAAKALTALNAERRKSGATSGEQNDKTSSEGHQHQPPNGFVRSVSNHDNLLLHSRLNDGNKPTSLFHKSEGQTTGPAMFDALYLSREPISQARTVESNGFRFTADDFGYQKTGKEESHLDLAVKNFNGQQKRHLNSESVASEKIYSDMHIREKLQNLPMLSALLKDKSLLVCRKNYTSEQLCKNSRADAARELVESSQHHRRSRLFCISEPDLHGGISKSVMNGNVQRVTNGNGIRHHSMEVFQTPSTGNIFYHDQNRRDSIGLSSVPITGRC